MTRPLSVSEQQCDAFKKLMTEGFYVIDADGEVDEEATEAALAATRPWRNEMWKAFRQIEMNYCPIRRFEQTGTVEGLFES